MKYSKALRDAAAEDQVPSMPVMPHDQQTRIRLDRAAQEAGMSQDEALRLLRHVKHTRSGALRFVSVAALQDAARGLV